MNLNDFQNLLLNKQELEAALGKKLDFSEITPDYLADYAMFEYIPLPDVINIFLGDNPRKGSKSKRYSSIYDAIEILVRDKKLPAKVEQEFDINGNEWRYDIYLSHDTAREYAETYGFLWNVPPYKCVKTSDLSTADNSELLHQLSKKDEEIGRLKAEIENLKQAQMQKTQIVDYEQHSIYGHTTEPIKAIFDVINRFWVNADLSQPDTIANAGDIEKWIEDNFDNVKVSKTIREAIQKITRPEQARYIGRKS
ncbi:hypothetical protein ABCW44_01400 [Mannheimia haemolytica]|uniref:hypothetical protein n=1 Tax=Mannheimia haemolytica TaxID=75985 RepID=UPI001ADA505A|nr:hypothetical protein [Mannheimia haemolytica]MDW0617946.1 hypothetical protein [Mannheimia haemolytica]UQX70307.1 hypothetical protein M3705_02170 [Mannheimia haemolytica]HDL1261440.1 hypothetical protein [Mannheimia haemolytica]